MKIDLEAIDNLLKESNLSEVAKAVGIPYRTLQAWKRGENKWWKDTQVKLTKLQNYVNEEGLQMNKLAKLESNWGIKIEDFKEDFKWLSEDPLTPVKKRMTRELGIKKEGGPLYRLKRVWDERENFVGLYHEESRKIWTGKVSVNLFDIREIKHIVGD